VSNHKKKKTTRYQEQEEQRVATYQEQIKDIPPEKIAYVDECGIDTYLYREYGYASRGQQVFGRISGRRYQRCGIVAAKMGHQIIAPFQYSGTMDSRLFDFWFSHQLLPSLDKGTVIVMDNASFHSKKRLTAAAQSVGCTLLFLPPYSPELSTLLSTSGPGLNASFVEIFPFLLPSTTLCLMLFNFFDYTPAPPPG